MKLTCALAVLGTFIIAFPLGYVARQVQVKDRLRPAAPSRCEMSAGVTAEQRNIVWRVWNREKVPEGPEETVGAILANLLHPKAPPALRSQMLAVFTKKGAIYLQGDDLDKALTDLFAGTPAQQAEAFRRLVEADHQAGRLMRSVLADKERVGLFQQGKPVPLE